MSHLDAPLIPQEFAERVRGYPPDSVNSGARHAVSGVDWLRTLPRLIDDLLREWSLVPDGRSWSGHGAVVVPVRADTGEAVLKVTWPHTEAAAEHMALRAWEGRGSVRLLRSDPARFALLLERLDGDRSLRYEPVEDACAVIGGLLSELKVVATPRIPSLHAYLEVLGAEPDPPPDAMPRRFVQQGRRLRAELMSHFGDEPWLLHTDLHFDNVLAATRQPWLAIDPHPLRGDRAYEVAPVLWNRFAELGTGAAMRWSVRERLETVCAPAGIDEERARAWSIVREVDNARWAVQDGDREALTRHVELLKALGGSR